MMDNSFLERVEGREHQLSQHGCEVWNSLLQLLDFPDFLGTHRLVVRMLEPLPAEVQVD